MRTFILFSVLISSQFVGAQEKLDVEGAIILSSSEDGTPTAGTIRWTGMDFEGWDGQKWVSLTHAADGTIGAVYDHEGNSYQTVQIGDQIWMSQNLASMQFTNGDQIPSGTGLGDISMENEPKYWFANQDDLNKIPIYGLLYTWHAVVDERKVCPVGWHLPSVTEWLKMVDYLGGHLISGGKLKATGTIQGGKGLWSSPNLGATNSSGFTAVPGGYRAPNGFFHPGETEEYYWASTETGEEEADVFALLHDESTLFQQSDIKKFGHSVRCIKD